ncbi:unnamed protein product [Linum tenue]|uniref:Uncharacterized protein n=1 Tax=Linum tenue TaxID=586396 RepID=A0AAV0R3E7_9ROSI|nr:unnamed protein product [Linum tenue]
MAFDPGAGEEARLLRTTEDDEAMTARERRRSPDGHRNPIHGRRTTEAMTARERRLHACVVVDREGELVSREVGQSSGDGAELEGHGGDGGLEARRRWRTGGAAAMADWRRGDGGLEEGGGFLSSFFFFFCWVFTFHFERLCPGGPGFDPWQPPLLRYPLGDHRQG